MNEGAPAQPAPPLPLLKRIGRGLGLHNPAPPDPERRAPLHRRLLRALNPANIPGPIFQKEVWISGRKAGTYWARALYTAGMLGFVTLIFVTANLDRFVSSPAQRLQVSQEFAPLIFTTVISFQFLALALAGCVLGAPAICEEKRSGTLATLLTTPLQAWQIVVGKTAAFFVQILILTLIATPLMLAIRVFGGLTSEVVISCTCLSLSTALLAGLLGLMSSVTAKRTPGAILVALILLVATQGIVPVTYGILAYYGKTVSGWNCTYASAPGAALMQLISQYGAPVPQRVIHDAWISSTAYNLALSAVALVLASVMLRRTMTREAAGGSPIPAGKKPKRGSPQAQDVVEPAQPDPPPGVNPNDPAALAPRKKKRVVYDHASRQVSDWPVLWRELRQSAFRSRRMLVYTTATFLVILGILYWQVGLKEDGLNGSVGVIAMLATLCIAAVSTTSGISGERESRTWEALLTTPMSARQIVAGKFLGAIRRQWFIPALLGIHTLVAGVYYLNKGDGQDPSVLPFILAVVTAPIIGLSGTGVLFSLVCRKSTLAAVCNFGLALAAWLVLPFVVLLTTELFRVGFSGRHELLNLVMLINPVGMMVEVLDAGFRHRYSLFDWRDVSGTTFAFAIAGYWFFYAMIGVVSLRIAAGVLATRSLRRV